MLHSLGSVEKAVLQNQSQVKEEKEGDRCCTIAALNRKRGKKVKTEQVNRKREKDSHFFSQSVENMRKHEEGNDKIGQGRRRG